MLQTQKKDFSASKQNQLITLVAKFIRLVKILWINFWSQK